MMHPTHKARVSDSSLYDEVCVHCNLTDMSPGWSRPCKKASVTEPPSRPPLDLTKPPFQTERGRPMHFVGYTKDGRTVWEDDEHWISTRRADGRLHDGGPDGDDVINAPPPKVKETLWANIYPPDGVASRGFLYSTLELAKANATADLTATIPVEVEYTPKEPK